MVWIGYSLIIGLLFIGLLALFFHHFNRDPDRTIPEGNVIVAPADGLVLDVIELTPDAIINMPKGIIGRVKAFTDDLGEEPHYMIPIFMNPFNVHVQRMPLDGTVLHVERRAGKFLMANSLNALENATVEMLFDSCIGKVKVLQTAGFLVRHIHNWLKPGQSAIKGERFGKIDFGSQVTLIFPKRADIEITVSKGDKVLAGETVVARFSTSQ